MRMLPVAGVACLLAAPPAAAQYQSTTPDVTTHSEVYATSRDDSPPAPAPSAWNVPETSAAPTPWPKPFRKYDWNRPEPGKTGYFADDYHTVWTWGEGTRLARGDRVYRGRNLRYYCRRWDGSTQLVDARGTALLGNALPPGGSAQLKAIPGDALATAVRRHEIRCGNWTPELEQAYAEHLRTMNLPAEPDGKHGN